MRLRVQAERVRRRLRSLETIVQDGPLETQPLDRFFRLENLDLKLLVVVFDFVQFRLELFVLGSVLWLIC